MSVTVIDLGVLWACADCLLVRETGEVPDVTLDEVPWSALELAAGETVAAGMDWSEHDDTCPNRAAGMGVDDCDCETREFSTLPCDTCGSRLAGTRHAYTLLLRELVPA